MYLSGQPSRPTLFILETFKLVIQFVIFLSEVPFLFDSAPVITFFLGIFLINLSYIYIVSLYNSFYFSKVSSNPLFLILVIWFFSLSPSFFFYKLTKGQYYYSFQRIHFGLHWFSLLFFCFLVHWFSS